MYLEDAFLKVELLDERVSVSFVLSGQSAPTEAIPTYTFSLMQVLYLQSLTKLKYLATKVYF